MDFVDQTATLLYLKLLDDSAPVESLAGAIDEQSSILDRALFPMQAERFRWRNWCQKPGPEVTDFINRDVIPYMASLDREAPQVAAFFKDAKVELTGLRLLKLITTINNLDLRVPIANDVSNILEDLLGYMDGPPLAGQHFRTPPAVRSIMIELINPSPGDSIHDPACGTGGLLVDAVMQAFFRGSRVDDNVAMSRLLPNTSSTLQVSGVDLSRQAARIATANLALHGVMDAAIIRGDALLKPNFSDELTEAARVDAILCDPPFNGLYAPNGKSRHLPSAARNTSLLFLHNALNRLTPGGRCVIVLPSNILSSTASTFQSARLKLLNDYNLQAVVNLPPGALNSGSAVRAAVLLIEKPKLQNVPASDWVWFYDLESLEDSRTLDGSILSPMTDFVEAWRSRNNNNAIPSSSSHSIKVSVDVILESDSDLSMGRYKPRLYANRPGIPLLTFSPDLKDAASKIADYAQRAIYDLDDWTASSDVLQNVMQVRDVAELIAGRPYTPTRQKDDTAELPILRISNVTGTKPVAEWYAGRERYEIVRKSDVLIANAGTIGVYRWDGNDGILGQDLILARPNPTLLNEQYFFYVLRDLIENLRSRAVGLTIKRIAKEQILNSMISVPSHNVQRQAVQVLEAFESLQSSLDDCKLLANSGAQSVMAKLSAELN